MTQREDVAPIGGAPFDEVAARLREWRAEAGMPSYAELVRRIAAQRVAAGAAPEGARPGRTTVYDAFRDGRRRLDPWLAGDIARALGRDEAEVCALEERCLRIRASLEGAAEAAEAVEAGEAAESAGSGEAAQAVAPAAEQEPAEAPVAPPAVRPPVDVVPQERGPAGPAGRSPRRAVVVLMAVVACTLVNLVGRGLVDFLELPLFLDMVGTAVAAIVLGPWWGVLVGVLTNVGGVALTGPSSLAFTVVNVVGALLWGYGYRRARRSVPAFFALNVGVALACSAVAVPIAYALQPAHDSLTTAEILESVLPHPVAALATANVLTSVVDKLFCGFVALAVLESRLGARARQGVGSRGADTAG